MSGTLFDLTGRVALVTGSSRGLGLVMARGLAEAGAEVILNGRNPDTLRAAVGTLQKSNLPAHGEAFDVTDEQAVASAVEKVEKSIGPIDILLSNAGVQRRAPLVEMRVSDWHKVVETNLTASFLVGREVARYMIPRKRGKIIVTCSLMTELARETISNYSAAKGGLRMLIRSMTVEWARYNIQINGIGPGYFLTEMNRSLHDDPAFNERICLRTPAGRWGDPKELAGSAVFLASSASDYINGQIIYVDGGILASL